MRECLHITLPNLRGRFGFECLRKFLKFFQEWTTCAIHKMNIPLVMPSCAVGPLCADADCPNACPPVWPGSRYPRHCRLSLSRARIPQSPNRRPSSIRRLTLGSAKLLDCYKVVHNRLQDPNAVLLGSGAKGENYVQNN